MKYLHMFISALLAGIVFSLGSAVYLQLYDTSMVAAALLFGVGIMAVLTFSLNLFNGKVDDLFGSRDKIEDRVQAVLVSLLGNWFGAAVCGFALSPMFKDKASVVLSANLSESLLASFIGALFCGILVVVGMHGYRRQGGGLAGSSVAIISAAAFVICGFEHSVINIFYCAASLSFGWYTLLYLAIVALGNAVGGFLFAELYDLKKQTEDERTKHHHHHHKHHSRHSSKVEEKTEA